MSSFWLGEPAGTAAFLWGVTLCSCCCCKVDLFTRARLSMLLVHTLFPSTAVSLQGTAGRKPMLQQPASRHSRCDVAGKGQLTTS